MQIIFFLHINIKRGKRKRVKVKLPLPPHEKYFVIANEVVHFGPRLRRPVPVRRNAKYNNPLTAAFWYHLVHPLFRKRKMRK